MHWQTRNWYYFTWLSGDFNVEQHVHFLDTCAWIMKDQYPVRAVGFAVMTEGIGPPDHLVALADQLLSQEAGAEEPRPLVHRQVLADPDQPHAHPLQDS
jgi:hypothetical protein